MGLNSKEVSRGKINILNMKTSTDFGTSGEDCDLQNMRQQLFNAQSSAIQSLGGSKLLRRIVDAPTLSSKLCEGTPGS